MGDKLTSFLILFIYHFSVLYLYFEFKEKIFFWFLLLWPTIFFLIRLIIEQIKRLKKVEKLEEDD